MINETFTWCPVGHLLHSDLSINQNHLIKSENGIYRTINYHHHICLALPWDYRSLCVLVEAWSYSRGELSDQEWRTQVTLHSQDQTARLTSLTSSCQSGLGLALILSWLLVKVILNPEDLKLLLQIHLEPQLETTYELYNCIWCFQNNIIQIMKTCRKIGYFATFIFNKCKFLQEKTLRMVMMILSFKSDFVWYGHQNLDGKLMKSLKSL